MHVVRRAIEHRRSVVRGLVGAALVGGCNGAPPTYASLDNAYPASKASPAAIVYAGWWQAVPFAGPIAPGESSGPQPTVSASDNTAYVVLAPGWDPTRESTPTDLVVLQSRSGYAVSLGGTLHIPVSDDTFEGDCAAGSRLTQQQADVITQLVFPSVFGGLRYDAATCTATSIADAAAP